MESDMTNTVSSSDGLSQGNHRKRDLHGRTTGPTRRSTKGQWTAEEDETLCKAVQRFKGKNWKKIAECFKDRTDVQCLHRWQKVLNPELVKGPWTKEEDEELVRLVEQLGPKKWSIIAHRLTGRIGKQCRERWHNHLNPAISKEPWTQEEEVMLIQAHKVYGNKWAELTRFLPGRTDNAIKNHWNSSVKKKLDAYLASGLLDQFQGLPCVSHTNQSTPTSSRTQQCSGDESIHKDAAEISECSQMSNLVRCSQSNNEIAKTMVVKEEDEDQPDGMPKAVIVDADNNTQSAENLNPGCSPNASLPCDMSGELDFMQYIDIDQNLEAVRNETQCSVGVDASNSVGNNVGFDMEAQMLTQVDNCLKVMQPDSLYYPESNCQIPPADALNSQSKDHSVCIPSQLSPCTNPTNVLSAGNQEFSEPAHDGFIYSNDYSNFDFYNNQDIVGSQVQIDQVMDSFDQIAVDSYSVHPSVDENLAQQEEPGLLSYDPPRFPSFDIPFLSCDLIQSSGDLQHEFSPLGTRQLMMTSMNCFSPCRLWDSPSCVDTPEVVLKSAAKAFTGTPSILKKRSRDLLSPLSEKSCGKKLERVSFFNSSKDVSKGDTMFYENHLPLCSRSKDCGPVSEDKENVNPAGDIVQDEGGNRTAINVQLRPGVLMEHNLDEKLFSCNKIATKLDTTPKGSHSRTPGEVISKTSGEMSDQATTPKGSHSKIAASCENPCQSFISPPYTSGKRNKSGSQFASTIHAAASSSAPLGTTAESPANGENSGIFGETPYMKSLESPSAWTSPRLSFVPGPRVDTNITIEDFGYFSSPGERSYDALGLMKQLSERAASAYANAREILGNETPDSILKKRLSEKGKWGDETPDSMIVLDFNDCGSPSKGARPGVCFASPSSHLLKGFR